MYRLSKSLLIQRSDDNHDDDDDDELLLGGDEPDLAPVQTTVSMTTVVAVAIAMVVALLIVIDVSCYFVNACGLTMCVCVHLCGHDSTATSTKPTSDKDVDDPERYDSAGDLNNG